MAAAASAAWCRRGPAPAALWPDRCPRALGHLEAPWCQVWGSDKAQNCPCHPWGGVADKPGDCPKKSSRLTTWPWPRRTQQCQAGEQPDVLLRALGPLPAAACHSLPLLLWVVLASRLPGRVSWPALGAIPSCCTACWCLQARVMPDLHTTGPAHPACPSSCRLLDRAWGLV